MDSGSSQQHINKFGSSFGVLVTLAGSAVGLGNIWRFPYLVGENGGAAFIIIYLISVLLIGIPILLTEFVIGRSSQTNAVNAFKVLAPGSKWYLVGVLGVLTSFLILCFYSVVGGWSLGYLFKACALQFSPEAANGDFESMFGNFISSPWISISLHFLFMAATATVVAMGVNKGIEMFSKILMPMLFVLMVFIAVRSLTMDGAGEGIDYLFKPDFSKVTGRTVLAAIGQSFFSLSLGMGIVLTYASYVSKSENILKCSVITAVSDTMFAIIAGCAIMPAVFAYGLDPGEGAGLVFVTLPYIFTNMPFGSILAIFFFVCLLIAALTSSISLLEVVISFVVDHFSLSRRKAVAISFSAFFLIGAAASLSLGQWDWLKIGGKSLFDFLDYVTSNYMMTVASVFFVIFLGWKMGHKVFKDEVTNDGTLHVPEWIIELLFFLIRYLAPVMLAVIIFIK